MDRQIRAPEARALFGHPAGMTVLAVTETWERFAFYGLQFCLMLYMTRQLLLPGHREAVVGLAAFRHLLSGGGTMSDLAFASKTFGLYSAAMYVTPLIGSWLGDRRVGQTPMVLSGGVLMTAGYLLLTTERWFLVALPFVILGAGAMKGNLLSQVSALYAKTDARRVRAFAIILASVNVGSLLAGLICGTLGEKVGWTWAFAAAAAGMVVSLGCYLAGLCHLPPAQLRDRSRAIPLTPTERRAALLTLPILLPYAIAIGITDQAYAAMFVWAADHVERDIGGWRMPVTWITIFDGLMTLAGIWLSMRLWRALNRRGREPGDLSKLAVGCAIVGIAYAMLAGMALRPVISLTGFLCFFAVMDLGFAWIDPPVNAFVSRRSAPSITGFMLALTMLSIAGSYLLTGWLGQWLEPLGGSTFWLLHASLAGVALVMTLALRIAMSDRHVAPPEGVAVTA